MKKDNQSSFPRLTCLEILSIDWFSLVMVISLKVSNILSFYYPHFVMEIYNKKPKKVMLMQKIIVNTSYLSVERNIACKG